MRLTMMRSLTGMFAGAGAPTGGIAPADATMSQLAALERRASDTHGLGLVNSGNSCYQNAVLQCLSMLVLSLARLRSECEWKERNGIRDLDVQLSEVLLELHYFVRFVPADNYEPEEWPSS